MIRLVLSILLALLLFVGGLGYTLFSARSTSVRCSRAGGHVSCTESETIGPYVAWSRTVEDIRIARDMSGSSDGNGVVAETESGDQVQLTSTFLDENQQADIANRVHQFIFVQQDQDTLSFGLAPSPLNLALGGAVAAAMLIWALVSAVRLGRRLLA